MSAEATLIRLIQSKTPSAVALIGSWGRGKTHLWRHLVKHTPDQAHAKYSYVSLFGANSIDDLKVAVFQTEIDAGPPAEEPSWWEKIWPFRMWRQVADGATQIENPWIGNLNSIYRAVSFSLFKDRLVCFDDFERRGKDLDIEQVLGLITFLCEERKCSVVMILNDSTLDDVSNWDKHREKVFHSEVVYRPTTEACLGIVFGQESTSEWHDGARKLLLQLDVSNMRIMSRIKESIVPLAERYVDISSETKQRIAASIALYSYCHNASGEGAPPVDRALRYSHDRLAQLTSKTTPSETERRWDSTLRKVDFHPEEIDQTVAAYIRDGHFDHAALDSQVRAMEEARRTDSAEHAFSLAWRAYHDSFQDNRDQVISLFQSSFPMAAQQMHAMNANSTISLMRRLGEDETADRFIEQWISPRRGERKRELSLVEAEIFGKLTDERFVEALRNAEREEQRAPDFFEAMETIADGHGPVDQSLKTLSLAPVDTVIQWLDINAGKRAHDFAINVLEYSGSDYTEVAIQTVHDALAVLRARSAINEIRVASLLSSVKRR